MSRSNRKGNFPLHIAVGDADYAPLVERIVGINPDATIRQNKEHQDSPLHIALEQLCDAHLISRLIDAGPSAVQMRNAKGELPLHIACRSGCEMAVIEKLCGGSSQLMLAVDKNANTPLHLACCSEWLQPEVILRLVVVCRSAQEMKNNTGVLPIHLFCAASGTRFARWCTDEMAVLNLLQSNYVDS